jgi:hypothetical protein
MSESKLDRWLKDGRYLPSFMRDFHDQKDLFKSIHQTIRVKDHGYSKDVDWVSGQCYVIDIFLWWMARRGYTLQRCRADQEFGNLRDTIRDCNERRSNAEIAALKSAFGEPK